jgi:4-amino-4-deoxy-L-arabinose transferase-like glycosyltransferase
MPNGRIPWLIALVAALLFIPGLGAVHLFDWDEINFAEIAREMLATGNWGQPTIDYLPFHEKPPLFIWLQALSMSVFGVGEFAARLPDALCGIITLLVLYHLGTRLHDRTFGLLWALAYLGSVLPHLYFRSGIIDPWFNLFIFLGLDRIIRLAQGDERPALHAWLAGLFLGLAVLTKGPVGVLIPGLVVAVYWTIGRLRPVLKWRWMLAITAGTVLTIGLWGAYDLLRHGPDFMTGFFWRQVAMLTTEDAGHGGFVGYHFVVLLIGCFPASIFALQELLKPARDGSDGQNAHRRWMVILFWVVLILFSLVKTKIVHYSSLCYFPLTYLAALQLHRIWKNQEAFGWSRLLLGGLGTLLALILIAVPFVGMRIDVLRPLLAQDPFAQANLDADVQWNLLQALPGLFLMGILLSAHFLHERKRYRPSLVVVFGGVALFMPLALAAFINRVEGYSQRAAIEFFEQRQGERCYVITRNYKSYAQLFYTRKAPVTDPRSHDEAWLLEGDIDRPVYVVCKITALDEVKAIPTLRELYEKNGFVFFRRDP